MLAQRHQIPLGNGGGEPLNTKVAGVRFEERRRVIRNGVRVVAHVSPVGRANVHQRATALAQHVRDAEPAADFHGLAPRHNNLAPRRQRGQTQQQRGCVVVHHQRRLGARDLPQQRLQMRLPRAAPAGGQVNFQVGISPRHGVRRRHGGFAQRRAAQVSVNHYAGSVNQRSGRRRDQVVNGLPDGFRNLGQRPRRASRQDTLAFLGQRVAGQVNYPAATVSRHRVSKGIRADDALDAGQVAEGRLIHNCGTGNGKLGYRRAFYHCCGAKTKLPAVRCAMIALEEPPTR